MYVEVQKRPTLIYFLTPQAESLEYVFEVVAACGGVLLLCACLLFRAYCVTLLPRCRGRTVLRLPG